MKQTTLLASTAAILLTTALAGCASQMPASDSSQHPPAASASPHPPTASAQNSPAAGPPKDVCASLSLSRVNQLTGLDLTNAVVIDPQGMSAAECQYQNAPDAVNASEQVNALVVTGKDVDTIWAATLDTASDKPAPLPGVGKRAVAGGGVVAIDYGGTLIIVDDWASTGETLTTDQLRSMVDEMRTVYP